MSSRTPPLTDIGKFYKQVDDFKEKMIIILKQFQKDKEIVDLNKYYDKLLAIKKVNVRTPIEFIYEYGVKKFAEEILTRDEAFFLCQVSQIVERKITMTTEGEGESSETVDQQDIFFISQVREVWHELQTNVKKNIWDYIQIICILAEKVMNENVLLNTRESLRKLGKLE